VGPLKPDTFVAVGNACAVWLTFGVLINDWVVIAPNAMGLVLSGYYWKTFVDYSPPGTMNKYFMGSAVVSGVPLVAALAMPGDIVTPYVGYAAGALALWLSISPLTALKTVMETKSTAALPFGISVGVVLNNASWVTYGILVAHNPFLVAPNSVGLAAGLVQLSMFGIYGFPPPQQDDGGPGTS